MATKLRVVFYPGEQGAPCKFDVIAGTTLFASGEAASFEQAERRCYFALGDRIGEISVSNEASRNAPPAVGLVSTDALLKSEVDPSEGGEGKPPVPTESVKVQPSAPQGRPDHRVRVQPFRPSPK